LAFGGDVGDTWDWKPDASGTFTFAAEEITKGASTHGGGYLGDPDGYTTETILNTATGLLIYVGTRLTAKIGAGADTATLAFYVINSTIRKTTLYQHGELTPVILNPSTDKARMAAESSTVQTELLSFNGTTCAGALGTPSSIIDDLIAKYELHRASGVYHASADATNTVAASFRTPGSPTGVARSANELRLKLARHMGNDNAGAGIGTAAYHVVSGNTRADQLHSTIVSGASEQDPLQTMLMIADLWRAYEAHRVDTTYHIGGGDTTNAASALQVIPRTYYRFLEALQAASPTAPATENPGVVLLVHSGGLKAG